MKVCLDKDISVSRPNKVEQTKTIMSKRKHIKIIGGCAIYHLLCNFDARIVSKMCKNNIADYTTKVVHIYLTGF